MGLLKHRSANTGSAGAGQKKKEKKKVDKQSDKQYDDL